MRLLLILALAFISSAALSEDSGPRKAENEAASPQTQNEHGAEAPNVTPPVGITFAPIINVAAAKHGHEPSQCAAGKDWKERGLFALCRSVEWLDAEKIIAAFTIILGFATWFLWRATVQLARDAKDLGEAQMSLTRTSNEYTRHTVKRQIRAYVFPDSLKAIDDLAIDVGKPPYGRVRIKNYGQTPAFKLGVAIGTAIGEGDPPEDAFLDGLLKATPDQVFGLPPQAEAIFPLPQVSKVVPPDQLAGLKEGKLSVLIFGRISYLDIFGGKRWTKFCMRTVPEPNGGYGFVRTKNYNESA